MKHNEVGPGRPSRQAVYQPLEEAIAELKGRLGGLPSPTEAEDIWTAIWYQEAHHSTALEGNILVLQQVEVLLAEGRAVGNKQLREYMEVRGYADAARWVYGQTLEPGDWRTDTPLSLTEVRHIPRTRTWAGLGSCSAPPRNDDRKPGSFRQHDIEPFQAG